jgi:processive 1,2-diacylglycerol beta-glucosyltransferase
MKILVISASTGAGHVRTGNAIIKHTQISHPDWETVHFDIAEFIPRILRRMIIDSYDSIAKKTPTLWKFIYEKTANNKFIHRGKIALTMAERMAAKKLKNAIIKISPDLIICTHPWAIDLVNAVQDQLHHIPLFVITTDYELHPYWGAHSVKKYFVASQAARQSLIDYGVESNTIFLSGIPIDPAFYLHASVDKKPDQKKDAPYNILIMSGGGGFSDIDRLVQLLAKKGKNLHICAIAGKNEKLHKRILEITPSDSSVSIDSVGWTDEIHKYFFASDIVITKPGGITTTECYVARKPIIAVHPVPGQEQANAKFITDHRLGVTLDDATQLIQTIESVRTKKHDPDLSYLPKPEMVIREIEKTLT